MTPELLVQQTTHADLKSDELLSQHCWCSWKWPNSLDFRIVLCIMANITFQKQPLNHTWLIFLREDQCMMDFKANTHHTLTSACCFLENAVIRLGSHIPLILHLLEHGRTYMKTDIGPSSGMDVCISASALVSAMATVDTESQVSIRGAKLCT